MDRINIATHGQASVVRDMMLSCTFRPLPPFTMLRDACSGGVSESWNKYCQSTLYWGEGGWDCRAKRVVLQAVRPERFLNFTGRISSIHGTEFALFSLAQCHSPAIACYQRFLAIEHASCARMGGRMVMNYAREESGTPSPRLSLWPRPTRRRLAA